MRWYVVLGVLAVPAFSIAGSPAKLADSDKAPTNFQVWKEKADASITAFCSPKEGDRRSITCEFLEVDWLPADEKELAKREQALIAATPSEKETAEWRGQADEFAKTTGELLGDPRIGVRAKGYIRRTIEAKDDLKTVGRLQIERERHSCTLLARNYRLNFKKIGEGKWVSSPEPAGLCNLIQVHTIERLDEYNWKFTSQVVARGGPKKNSFCDWADEKEAKEVEVFKGDNVQEFEPSCDFVKYTLVPGDPD